MTQSNPSPNSFMQQNERNASRTRSPRGKSPSGRMSRCPCKDYLKGTCINSFCEKWHPPECLFYKTKSGCKFGEKCSYAHRQVDEQPSKRSKKNDDKSAVAMLKKNDWRENVRARRRIRALDPSPWRKSSQPLSTGVGAAARSAPSLNDLFCSPAKPTQTWNSSSASLASGATLLIGESSDFSLRRPSTSKRDCSLSSARRRLRLRHRLLASFIWSDRSA